MDKLIASLLYHSNIYDIDRNDLYLQLLSHSEYPSIKAVTDTLDYFGVDNLAISVPKDSLEKLPTTFLALIEENKQTQLVLITQRRGMIYLKKQGGKKQKVPGTVFLKQWTGIIIAVEKEEQKEIISLTKRFQSDMIFVALLALAAIVLLYVTYASYVLVLNTLLTLLGLGAGYFIIKEVLGIKDELISKLCGVISNKKGGCGAVIDSQEGKWFNRIPLKDMTIIYFSSIFIIMTLMGPQISLQFFLSAISIPMVLFLIYQQAFVIKKWCPLCLIISGVLGLQFGLMLYAFSGWDFSVTYILYSAFIALCVTFGWYQVKKLWTDSIQLKVTRKAYYTLKRNKDLFFYALYGGRNIKETLLNDSYNISFGKESAEIRILAITNPLCGYCGEPFKMYVKLLEQYPQNIRISLVFNVSPDPGNRGTQMALRIIDLYKKDKNAALLSLIDWYKEKDLASWAKKYEKDKLRLSYAEQVVEAHVKWCEEAKIYYTPETFINDHSFPKKQYHISDLQFFIEELKSNSFGKEIIIA